MVTPRCQTAPVGNSETVALVESPDTMILCERRRLLHLQCRVIRYWAIGSTLSVGAVQETVALLLPVFRTADALVTAPVKSTLTPTITARGPTMLVKRNVAVCGPT